MIETRTSGPPTAALAGDWHGDRAWANARLQSLGERGIDVVLHAGDFGV
jgi:predicted phosphodiesterase